MSDSLPGCNMPGLPVHHQLLELTQTHVHKVGDAIQPSHPLSSPSPPAFNLSLHQRLFQWVSSSHQVDKVAACSECSGGSDMIPFFLSSALLCPTVTPEQGVRSLSSYWMGGGGRNPQIGTLGPWLCPYQLCDLGWTPEPLWASSPSSGSRAETPHSIGLPSRPNKHSCVAQSSVLLPLSSWIHLPQGRGHHYIPGRQKCWECQFHFPDGKTEVQGRSMIYPRVSSGRQWPGSWTVSVGVLWSPVDMNSHPVS